MAEDDHLIKEPYPLREAFFSDSLEARATQAAILLFIGYIFDKKSDDFLNEEEREFFKLPKLQFDDYLDYNDVYTFYRKRYRYHSDFERHAFEDKFLLSEISSDFFENPSPLKAACLLEYSVRSNDPLMRVSAAVSELDCFRYAPFAWDILFQEARSRYKTLVSEIANAAIGRHLNIRNSLTQADGKEKPFNQNISPEETSLLLVHGTLPLDVKDEDYWWRPSQGLHAYLKNGSRPDIYSNADFFEWEGGHTDHARAVAGGNLTKWLLEHGSKKFDLVCHSHGGNIAIEATHQAAKVNKLILLACPYGPNIQLPSDNCINESLSVRVKIDLVILAARLHNRFPAGTINDQYLPYWFLGHSDIRKREIWSENNLDQYLS